MSNGPQVSHWCYTLYDTEPEVHSELLKRAPLRYWVFQQEQCPTTGRIHIQGYLEYKRSVKLASVKLHLGNQGVHLEPRRGTRDEARQYCKKDESRIAGPFEGGDWMEDASGKRTDLQRAKGLLDACCTDVELADECFESWVRYRSSFSAYRELKRPRPEHRDIRTHILYGPTGTGKTHRACGYGDDYWILTRPATKNMPLWFDGYQGQLTLIIDEFYGWIPFDFLLRLLDKYKLQLSIRGGYVWACFTTVFITSNVHPDVWYQGVPDDRRPALLRRFSTLNLVESQDLVLTL